MTDSSQTLSWDAMVIGGGPSGLFAAYEMARAGRRVMLLEAGGGMFESLCPKVRAVARGRRIREAEKFRLQCAQCTCLTGLGGAAFHFDTNLGYITGLTRSKVESDGAGGVRAYSGLERALGNFETARSAVHGVYETFYQFGLSRAEGRRDATPAEAAAGAFAYVDTAPSQSITVDEALIVLERMCEAITAGGGSVLLHHRAAGITRSGDGFEVFVEGEQGGRYSARSVIVAVGKLGLDWVRTVLRDLSVEYTSPRRVDIGVRLETSVEAAAPLTATCDNPKLGFLNAAEEPVRTFCVCVGGRIMQYQFLDTVVLDGQHCLSAPTRRTNFGVVTTVAVPEATDGSEFALDFARRVNKLGGAVVQSLGDFMGRPAGGPGPGSSLPGAVRGDLAAVLGPERVADVVGMVERLNDLSPGMISSQVQVAAPVVERIYPSLTLTGEMESSVPGLFFVGDASSKIIGVTYGAVTGRVAARAAMAR